MPPNTMAMLRRHMERIRMLDGQIKAIEQARLERLEEKPDDKRNKMVFLLTRIFGLGVETSEQLVHEALYRDFSGHRRWPAMPG